MRYPCLVPPQFCKTPVKVVLEQEGISEEGEPLETATIETTCNYQDTGKKLYTAEQKIVQLTGVAMFPGDICPSLPTITSGIITVNGVERNIAKGQKARNPDGTVNYTRLEVV